VAREHHRERGRRPAVSIRYTAGKMLARAGNETAVPLLASALHDLTASVAVRRYAARYLGTFDTAEVRDALGVAIAHEPASVVERREYGSIHATARNELTSE
jgi:HEAT repeat protein